VKSATFEGRGFVIASALVSLIVVLTASALEISHHLGVDHGLLGVSLTPVWLGLGVAIPLVALALPALESVWSEHGRKAALAQYVSIAALGVVVLVLFSLLVAPARKFALVIAIAEFGLVWAMDGGVRRSVAWYCIAGLAIANSWAMTIGFPYTNLANWLMNATGSSALAVPAFVGALVLATYASFIRTGRRETRAISVSVWIGALVAFVLLALRNDNETAVWIPYHQSYFTAPAALVRDHHWLLWDIPSQYGFLSIIAIALTPGRTIFDAFHLLVGVVLTLEGAMLFELFRFRRTGVIGTVFAFAVVSAALFSTQAAYYPFGARLYPQEGLRFLWPLAILFIAFCRYRWHGARRDTWFMAVGHLCWLLGVLWSVETGLWTSIVWIGYIGAEAFALFLASRDAKRTLVYVGKNAAIIVVAFALTVAVLQLTYVAHFGHGPDWASYIEFSAIYTSSSSFAMPYAVYGAGWVLVAAIIAVLCVIAKALQLHQYRLVPLLAAAWFAVWGTSLYYVGEGFEDHVAAISAIIAAVGAIVSIVSLRHQRRSLTSLAARLTFVPLFVILIAYAYGAPSHLRDIAQGGSWNVLDATAELPTISGELAGLERHAGIGLNDRVLYPNSIPWNKISSGIILPIERAPDGERVERLAWLPTSPVGLNNTFLTLPFPRRATFIDRYLEDSANPGGWYITYRVPASCKQLSPRLVEDRRMSSPDYNAIHCIVR
jgi:hypothetical protein